mmetsp:Transcript_26130/g.57114  ORF Transcript_26130/g.57114 Transcript_26130/m.57114 type:complete len:203 (-) Transcript_26130:709-1317(-)
MRCRSCSRSCCRSRSRSCCRRYCLPRLGVLQQDARHPAQLPAAPLAHVFERGWSKVALHLLHQLLTQWLVIVSRHEGREAHGGCPLQLHVAVLLAGNHDAQQLVQQPLVNQHLGGGCVALCHALQRPQHLHQGVAVLHGAHRQAGQHIHQTSGALQLHHPFCVCCDLVHDGTQCPCCCCHHHAVHVAQQPNQQRHAVCLSHV